MYVMTNSGKLFADNLTEWLLEASFIKSQCHMSIYYKYVPDGTKFVVLSYVDDCIYWYNSEALVKLLVGALGTIFHFNFLLYAHWFISIQISQMKDHYISVYKSRYATSSVAEYLDTATVTTSTNDYKTTLPYDMVFTKSDASNIDEKVDKFSR